MLFSSYEIYMVVILVLLIYNLFIYVVRGFQRDMEEIKRGGTVRREGSEKEDRGRLVVGEI